MSVLALVLLLAHPPKDCPYSFPLDLHGNTYRGCYQPLAIG